MGKSKGLNIGRSLCAGLSTVLCVFAAVVFAAGVATVGEFVGIRVYDHTHSMASPWNVALPIVAYVCCALVAVAGAIAAALEVRSATSEKAAEPAS